MAYTGGWKSRQVIAPTPMVWGTGINPVHSVRTGLGRETAPGVAMAPLPAGIQEQGNLVDYTSEDTDSALWGYGTETGTADRPRLDALEDRQSTGDFPSYGPKSGGRPGGNYVRSLDHGAEAASTIKQIPTDVIWQDWINKEHGDAEYPQGGSDVSQLLVTTSDVQLRAVRTGSQAAPGRANAPRASIASRITGQKVKHWPGGRRHLQMFPFQQDLVTRPWWSRQAGTGDPDWMAANAQRNQQPMQREPAANPYQGPTDLQRTLNSDAYSYGWTPEDVNW